MHRRSFLHQSAFAFGALTLAQQSSLSSLFEDPWKIKMLSANKGIFTEKGGTIAFLLANDGIVVVDAEFPEQSQHLIGELKKKTDQPFQWLINTHHHADHTSGNISFKGLVPHVLAHENSLANQKTVAAAQKTEDTQLFPDQTFSSSHSIDVDDEKITLHYFGAGHTNGDAMIHFENDNIVHMGDLVFNRRHPFVDRSAGASIKSWITVLDKALSTFTAETTFVFGHAGDGYEVDGKAADLRAFQQYLQNILDFVAMQIKAGQSKEDIVKTTVLPFVTEWKGDGLNRPLDAAYEELTAK